MTIRALVRCFCYHETEVPLSKVRRFARNDRKLRSGVPCEKCGNHDTHFAGTVEVDCEEDDFETAAVKAERLQAREDALAYAGIDGQYDKER